VRRPLRAQLRARDAHRCFDGAPRLLDARSSARVRFVDALARRSISIEKPPERRRYGRPGSVHAPGVLEGNS